VSRFLHRPIVRSRLPQVGVRCLSGSQGQGFARRVRIPAHSVGALAQDEIDRTDFFPGCKGLHIASIDGEVVIVLSRTAISGGLTAGLTFIG
jgi:hypothetical protein